MEKIEAQERQEFAENHTALPGHFCPPSQPSQLPLTCINVAVPYGMDGMLAFTSTLAKEPGGQVLGHREGLGLGRIAHVHDLVGCVQRLEAALAVLPEALQQGSLLNPISKGSQQSSALPPALCPAGLPPPPFKRNPQHRARQKHSPCLGFPESQLSSPRNCLPQVL